MDSHQSASLFAAKSFLKHSLSHSSAPRGPLYHAAEGCSARLSCPSEARGLGTEITPYWVMLAAWVGLGEARPRRLRAQCQIVSRMDSSWLGELGGAVCAHPTAEAPVALSGVPGELCSACCTCRAGEAPVLIGRPRSAASMAPAQRSQPRQPAIQPPHQRRGWGDRGEQGVRVRGENQDLRTPARWRRVYMPAQRKGLGTC